MSRFQARKTRFEGWDYCRYNTAYVAYLKFKEVQLVCHEIGIPVHGGSRARGYSSLALELGLDASSVSLWFGLNVYTWGNYKTLFKKADNAMDALLARPLPHGVAEYDEARDDRELLTALLSSNPEEPLRPPHALYEPTQIHEKRMTSMGFAAFQRLVNKYV